MPTVPLRVGVQLPEVERDVRWPEVRAIALAAEECGFDSVWLGDHLLYRGGGRPERAPWDVWTQLAALAAVTSQVRLGPLNAKRKKARHQNENAPCNRSHNFEVGYQNVASNGIVYWAVTFS